MSSRRIIAANLGRDRSAPVVWSRRQLVRRSQGRVAQCKGGESVAIVGKSGSGKSTLMHLLALLDNPDSGALTINGTNVYSLKSATLNRLRNADFGFVFQQFFLIPTALVLENVILPLKVAGVPPRKRKLRGLAALAQLELADKHSDTTAIAIENQLLKLRTVVRSFCASHNATTRGSHSSAIPER